MVRVDFLPSDNTLYKLLVFSPLSAFILPSLLPTHSAPKPFLLPYAWATKVKGKINSLKGLQPHE